ncbi:MAG: hypothetical protein FJ291_05570 [Planctomycetes bacterium]|nr:hypothetical protein [Planctomycetota bacterium]
MKKTAIAASALWLLLAASSCAPPAAPQPPAKAPAKAQPSMAPWELELRAKLRLPITVEFRDASLDDAIAAVSRLAEVPIRLDPAVDAKAGRVSLPKMTVPAEKALRWVCFGRCGFVFRDKAVLVVQQTLSARLFDISSLLRASPARFPPGPLAIPEDLEKTGEGWCRYIRHVVAPETWGEQPKGTLDYRNGRLLATNTPPVLDAIEKLLDSQRKMRTVQVNMFARFIVIRRTELEALKLPLQPVGSSEGEASSGSYAPVREAQIAELMNAIVKRRKGTIISAPRLTCFNAQLAVIQMITKYSYIRTVPEDGKPEVGNEPPGIFIWVQPFVSPDRKQITPIVEGVYRSPDAEPPLPRLDAVITLPNGGSVLFVPADAAPGRSKSRDGNVLAIVLSAETVEDIFEE